MENLENDNIHRLEVLPQQLRFLTSTAREILYSGAFGSGKSFACALRCAMRASVPGSREGLCRKTFTSLKRSTLKSLLEPDGVLPPILPPGSYIHKKIDSEIHIKGGGTIMLFGLEDANRISSTNLSGVCCDECVQLEERDWTMLRGRIRLSLPNLPNQIYGACNPSTPQHWLAKRFGLAGGYKCAPNCEAITTCSSDNWFLPPDYLADLETLTGVAGRRFRDGIWCGSDGLVYDQWDETRFVVDEVPTEFDRLIVGVDQGFHNPTCFLLVGLLDQRVFVIREFYERQKLEQEVVEMAQQWKEEHPAIDCFVVDPAAATLRAALRHVGLDVLNAKNPVFHGIQTVASTLKNDPEGKPLLSVQRSCTNLIREFGSYEWATNQDGTPKDMIPKKQYDHGLDSLRYSVLELISLRHAPALREIGDLSGEETTIDPILDERLWTEI